MKETVNVSLKEEMTFEVEVNGHKIIIDADDKIGGGNKGPRPKPLMLAALGGCTAMDVVSILRKMRIKFKAVNVIVDGELTEEHPRHFFKVHITYEFTGKDLPLEKLEKAVSLSQDRYCGVSYSYRKAMEMTHEIKIIVPKMPKV
ncbi:MAG: OsmC family protein [Bacteroidetes bacterium]|nr:OsmC family protein [Bacteroidota bacterium]